MSLSNITPRFVVGLPRSRTFWFSKLLHAHGEGSAHELVRATAGVESYTARMSNGCIDCTSLPIITNPKSEVVLIVRQAYEVVNSLRRLPPYQELSERTMYSIVSRLREMIETKLKVIDSANLYVIRAENLSNPSNVAGALEHLGVRPNFDIINERIPKVLTCDYLKNATYSDLVQQGNAIAKAFNLESI